MSAESSHAHARRYSLAIPHFLILGSRDNVAVALAQLRAGHSLALGGTTLTLLADISIGHKFAIREISRGGPVVKYSEVIGTATDRILPGAHVHVHNVVSARLPGRVGKR
jgi:hypothetical protein